MTNLLAGIHDREGRHIVPSDGWVVDVVALSENPQPTDYAALRADVNWLVRLSWGFGSTGTIPAPSHYAEFAQACADYARNSRGAYAFIIGNEPNHQNERPNGDVIWPQMYADCFNQCYSAMKGAMATRGGVRVMPAPIAPWDATTKYPSNPNGDWVMYFADTLNAIPFCDGLVLHTYTHGAGVPLITSSARMQPPFAHRHFEFRAYRDFLDAVPESKRGLPVYITETDQIEPWTDANTGWVQAAYGEVDWWNGQAGTQKIHCLCLYRWPRYDRWFIEGKQGVINDFHAAVAKGYRSPEVGASSVSDQTFIPAISVGDNPALPKRDWDERLTQRGVTVETPQVAPGQQFWRVVKAQWYDEQQAGGRHHIYVEAPANMTFRVDWPSGFALEVTNGRSGFDAGNFPMSPSLNEFSVRMDNGTPSEMLKGIGMGADGNPGIHTSTLVKFELVTMPQATTPPHTQHIPSVIAPGPTPPPQEPVLSGDDWPRSIAWVLQREGGFQANPNDSGNYYDGQLIGTKFGISAAVWGGQYDIPNLTIEQAESIYFTHYWQASRADTLPWPACLLVLDTAILHGVGAATKWLGEVGPNPYAFAAKRLRVYTRSDKWEYFGAGWVNRVSDLLEAMV